MNKDRVLEILFRNMEYTKEQMETIELLEEAKNEWEAASTFFQYVSEPSLVDYAIHLENAAKAKYTYYLNRAKTQNIEVDYVYMLD